VDISLYNEHDDLWHSKSYLSIQECPCVGYHELLATRSSDVPFQEVDLGNNKQLCILKVQIAYYYIQLLLIN